MSEEFRLSQVSAMRDKIQMPGFLTVEEKNEILGSLLSVPVVTEEVSVTITRLDGTTHSYVVPAFTSADAVKGMICEAEGIPVGQIKLLHKSGNQVLANEDMMGSLVEDRMMLQQPCNDTGIGDDDINDMPDFGMHRQVSNESTTSTHSNVELTLVRQARTTITKIPANAEVRNEDKDVYLGGPSTAILEDCGPGSKVMVRLLARGVAASYIAVCDAGADVNCEPTGSGCCSICSTDMLPKCSWFHDGQAQELDVPRFICGDVLTISFAADGQSVKFMNNADRIGRFPINLSPHGEKLAIAVGGDQGTKWQVLDSTTPEMWLAPKGLPFISHWDINLCSVSANFKRVNFFDQRRGTVMLKGCGAGTTVIARALQKGPGPLYIGLCEQSFALPFMPIIQGAHTLLDNGGLSADGNHNGPVFPGFRCGDVLTLTVSADGTAFALAQNGRAPVIVNNVPAHPPHVVCLGGVGPCLWELA